MKNKNKEKFSPYHSGIIKGIFKGMTISQIACEMCCSVSTVSYHINSLYAKYKAKTRVEFIINVFAEIVEKYKVTIDKKDIQISALLGKYKKLKVLLGEIIENKNSSTRFEKTLSEAKKYL